MTDERVARGVHCGSGTAVGPAQEAVAAENPAYLTEQLITYLGNKRALLPLIDEAVGRVQAELGGRPLRVLDAFSGSGVVSRLLKRRASFIYANDIEDYARVISQCYLTNACQVNWPEVDTLVAELAGRASEADAAGPGLFERLYAPADEKRITAADRVFYTRDNARRLDRFRRALESADEHLRVLLLGPLLSAASVHANTAGLFKGFYKDRATGIGRYGGSGSDALFRIRGQITPRRPVLSACHRPFQVFQADANCLPHQVGDLDLAYLDPPYNQHPYGSNYFMLNLLVNYREPAAPSRVSGIPRDWRRSDYNVRSKAANRFAELIANLDARYLLVSFNDEGFIAPGEMRALLAGAGSVQELAVPYNTFRGSRNLRQRKIHVSEHLFLVKKGR